MPTALHEALARARQRWPDVRIDDEPFVAYVRARVDDEAAIASVHAEDLFLACACALGDPRALAAFEAAYLSAIRSQAAKIEPQAADDLAQRILARMLVGEAGQVPSIASYAGRSSLAAWLKVVATREALMHRRKAPDPAAALDESLAEIVDADDDPELGLIRARHGDDFRRAFEDAFAELEANDRTLLKFQLVDRLTIDELAKMHGVHRATAARWVAKAREKLLRGTRRSLVARLRLSHAELESLFRLVQSQLEVSVRRLLDASPSRAAPGSRG